jgi:HlyD family secretion protein
MRRLLKWILILAVLGGAAAFAVPKLRAYSQKRNQPKFRTAKVTKGDLTWDVRTTGKIEPVLKIQIGSFVSGPITEIHADSNDIVEKGQLLAQVDPRLYRAAVLRDKAALATTEAEVKRVEANLQQAMNDERRAMELNDINPYYISDSEMDQYRFAKEALEAQLSVAKESIKQAAALLTNSETNLEYTNIVAPLSGVIIERKINPGQTLASQFQSPELFVLAPDMDKRMWIHASVVEADIGHVMRAKDEERPVEFFVDAYENELFVGKIHEVRQNPIEDQTVVTYPVIVECANPDKKLLPGMTANLSFEIERKDDVLRIPGAAIRYLPDVEYVREEDKEILEGKDQSNDQDEQTTATEPSAAEAVKANRNRRQRHVWVQEGNKLRAVKIEFGLSDGKYYELVEGALKEGQKLVVGVKPSKSR